jgi:hypothetical protein
VVSPYRSCGLSVFHPVIHQLEHFVLKGDDAVFVLPPVGGGVLEDRHGIDADLGADKFELLAEQPAGPPGMKYVGDDDEAARAGGTGPVANGDRFIVGAGDALADEDEGGFRDVLFEQDLAGEFGLVGVEFEAAEGPGFFFHDEDDGGQAGFVEAGGFGRAGVEAAAQDDDGVGFGEPVADDPEAGGGAQDGGAEIVEGGKENAENNQADQETEQPAAEAGRAFRGPWREIGRGGEVDSQRRNAEIEPLINANGR